MYINLFDTKKQQDVRLDVVVEYATPSPHLLLVLFSRDVAEELENNMESKAYGEYAFKALHHLAGVKFKHEGRPYALTLGFFLDTNGLVPALIEQPDDQQTPRFTSAQSTNLHHYESFTLINAQEYDWLTKLGLTKLSLPEYVAQVIEEEQFRPWASVFYDITLEEKETFQLQDLVDSEQFEAFLKED